MQVSFDNGNAVLSQSDFLTMMQNTQTDTNLIATLYADRDDAANRYSDVSYELTRTKEALRITDNACKSANLSLLEMDTAYNELESDCKTLRMQFDESQAHLIRLGMLNDALQDKLDALTAEKESRATLVTALDKVHRFADDKKLSAVERDLLIAIFNCNKIKGIARYRSEVKCKWHDAHGKAATLESDILAYDETITLPICGRRKVGR